ncbi:CD-NTase-associated protein 12/Pycsar effector protein TIR domain-containing protein [Vibrio crassostreae]|uniref:TIR domain-containing protein n=1 Tax=Vibrio TaxID=662 RepID=UPI000F4A22ED|nr:nucleotide-binding protein [Vibrio crassostreae]ROO56595.1 putative nucleotide-binding protein with TIR-like domain [Vibrio crassostreae]CAK2001637.1 CD-NTase-associated protein 12/Pycsar effector protein TIR domain-containing protein [Vibrio crassostreae]CAK2088794.1 CD-NTase-associated protein 12/Pycsar effector protein TIR domain-containing protein [Vibrio crassostreae]CAK2944396.1 CD-NTase-associated protein 12/Pycsar effector protein TIR domain-containing protein [Vibrio crassostreae]C
MDNVTKLFIGSSVEGLKIAESVKSQLEHSCVRAEIWTQGTFKANGYPLEQLESALEKYQYGLFVMTPDDLVSSRGEQFNVARDNVLLELGMFIGRYGRSNCFILVPRGESAPRMPSDLTGFNTVDYDPSWASETGSMDAALGSPVRSIKLEIEKSLSEQSKTISSSPGNDNSLKQLEEVQNTILKLLFSVPNGTKSNMIVDYMSIDKSLCLYHIDQLAENSYVNSLNDETFVITDKGRKQVVEVIGL